MLASLSRRVSLLIWCQAHPSPVDVGTETDGQLQEAQAALEAQRSQAQALKRRILELQVLQDSLSHSPVQAVMHVAPVDLMVIPL